MKVVLDTNILLVAISPKSKDYWIFEAFLTEQFTLCVTIDILKEYEEIVGREMGSEVAKILMSILENAPNVELIQVYFRWNLIENDPDDNKFVDCAITSNANFLVSEDRHFNVLARIPFPKVTVLTVADFARILAH
jgi:uncharacterized protein